jgi:cytochrome b6
MRAFNLRAVWNFLDERFLISELAGLAAKKTVPEHRRSFWYFFGGICLFLAAIQVATGVLLLLYYTPTVEAAHESIQFIMGGVRFGWLIRSVHSWTANILIGMLFVHMFSTFFLKAYRRPRELTWVTGFLLLVLFMAFGFSGYLLPWNELSYFATRVGTNIAGNLPLLGPWLKSVILGGPEISQATLSRFYWFHIALLPVAGLILIAAHVVLVQTLGMSKPIGERVTREIPFFPDFLYRDALGWTLILVVVGVLCVFLPWEVGAKADPLSSTPLGIKPEWYFTFMFSTLKIVPAHILSIAGEKLAILGFLAGGLLWMLVPFLDRRARREERSPVFGWIGLALAAYIVIMTVLTYTVPNL